MNFNPHIIPQPMDPYHLQGFIDNAHNLRSGMRMLLEDALYHRERLEKEKAPECAAKRLLLQIEKTRSKPTGRIRA